MAKPKAIDAKVNALTRIVEKGFAALADDISHRPTNSSVAGIVENVIHKMVPGIVREEVKDIRDELASIRKDLEQLTTKVDNSTGLPKEIDHALERIRKIEKYVGIHTNLSG
jgi:hypothetical protein